MTDKVKQTVQKIAAGGSLVSRALNSYGRFIDGVGKTIHRAVSKEGPVTYAPPPTPKQIESALEDTNWRRTHYNPNLRPVRSQYLNFGRFNVDSDPVRTPPAYKPEYNGVGTMVGGMETGGLGLRVDQNRTPVSLAKLDARMFGDL